MLPHIEIDIALAVPRKSTGAEKDDDPDGEQSQDSEE